MRPWSWDEAGSHVQAEVGWEVLEPTRLAVLDHALVTRINPWPQLGVELFNRGTRRAHHLAVALAIAHHQRVEDRLLLTLWHLAERWGKVTPDGILVPLPLSHQRLAEIVGAHRPSVTTAMGALAKAGRVSRRDDGDWLLHGDPPEKLRHHKLAAALSLKHDGLKRRALRVVQALAEPARIGRDRELRHLGPDRLELAFAAAVGDPQAAVARVCETAVAEEDGVLDRR